MTALILGPSSVGKSTFLSSPEGAAFQGRPQLYGFQIETDTPITPESVIHYNILHQALAADGVGWSIKESPVLNRVLSGPIDRCIVLATPIEELKSRMSRREIIEREFDTPYDRDLWLNIAARTDFFRLYDELLDLLDARGVKSEILVSFGDRFDSVDRVFLHANLKGRFISPPDLKSVSEFAGSPECEYQTVTLPYGLTTSRNGFDHLPADRVGIFKRLLPRPLFGQSVLDVGCALGELLFTAERLGASNLVGLEPMSRRFAAAAAIGSLLRSEVVFHNVSLHDFNDARQFDHVFALNVLHHVEDFRRFISDAARRTKKTLTLEFPTLSDPKFCDTMNLSVEFMTKLNDLPLIAASSPSRADQHYVFSPIAVSEIVMGRIGGFSSWEAMESPITNRVILRFIR